MSIPGPIDAVAADQHGVFTRAQALAAGFTARQIEGRLRARRWVRVLPRVYGDAPLERSPLTRVSAAVLWAGHESAVSYCSAAALWDLDLAGHPAPAQPEVLVPARRAPRAAGVIVHRSAAMCAADIRRVLGLPVTSPLRTILDLAAVLTDDELAIAIETARARGLLTPAGLLARLEEIDGAGRAGIARARRVGVALTNSARTAARLHVEVAGLAPAAVRPATCPGQFMWHDARVLVECDAREQVARGATRTADRARRAALASRGWDVVVVTWDDLSAGLTARLAHTLARRARDCSA
jgi:hypothetical protein